MVKGSHIVVPRIAGADDAYIFQNSDGRVVFALPYEGAFTLIGTTDSAYTGDPRDATATADDQAYLLDVANRYFRAPLTVDRHRLAVSRASARWTTMAAITRRPSAAIITSSSMPTRARRFCMSSAAKSQPTGGLAEAALDFAATRISRWARPGRQQRRCRAAMSDQMALQLGSNDLARRHAGFARNDLARLARRYGTRVDTLLDSAATLTPILVSDLGGGLRVREVAFLKREEWAVHAADVMWRRTKAGLHVPPCGPR